ncbi:unnamed protein product, partial [Leptidea sinapis]
EQHIIIKNKLCSIIYFTHELDLDYYVYSSLLCRLGENSLLICVPNALNPSKNWGNTVFNSRSGLYESPYRFAGSRELIAVRIDDRQYVPVHTVQVLGSIGVDGQSLDQV